MDFDFSDFVFNLLASMVIVFRRFFLLIVSPYKTMRRVSKEKDYLQVLIIFGLVFSYFLVSSSVRVSISPFILFFIFLANFSLMVIFFYFLGRFTLNTPRLSSLIFTLSYSLLPTLVWFTTNFLLYLIVPPPRTASFFGQAFSLVFIAFSLTVFFWKLILVYLALRFSLGQGFYKIIYFLLLYLLYLLPFSLLMYQLKIFRIPFI